jgi:hypothetical protein
MRRETTERAWGFVLLLMVAAFVSASPLAKRTEQNGSTMDLTDKGVAEKFVAFQNEQEPALVQEALEMIEAVEQGGLTGDKAARKRGLSRWLFFYAALDQYIDPQWDPEEVPTTGVIPPPSHGVVYPSGVDPSVIADPAARVQYEQELKVSKDYAEWYRVQLLLRRICERATAVVGRLLTERYTNSEEDRQEIEGLLAASPMNDARKERVRSLIPESR